MARHKVCISYSHEEKHYLEELVAVLRTVRSIDDVLWFDERGIDIGDRFDANIQQALAESGVGILLLSNRFFTSSYITEHELPYLLREAEQHTLKLGCLYVTTIPKAAFEVRLTVNGQQRIVNFKDYLGAHSPNTPLNTCDEGTRDAIYAELANWVTRQLSARTAALPRQPGPRYELAIAMRARGDHWEHRFALPHAGNFARPDLPCPTPQELCETPGYTVDGDDLFQVLFGSDLQQSGAILGAVCGTGATADPTRDALRVRLLTDDDRLHALPWGRISYQGRALVDDGWTVEFHVDSVPGFPEYATHICSFPGKVVLIGSHESLHTPQL